MRRRAALSPAAALALAAAPWSAPPCSVQAGDVEGEAQPELPEDLVVPPAPALSPADELATFALAPGLEIELVASEPLVVDPVAVAFDELGRLWVVEMRGFMPDVDGHGEGAPAGRVAVLSDVDGDGRMDRRADFIEDLVLPRAVAPARGGALVIAPPELLFCRDTDGDGRADERVVVDRGLEGRVHPEHGANGLLRGLDNWYWCADHDRRYRFENGRWTSRPTAGGGQWGIAKDDRGRLFFSTDSGPLRCDRVSSHYSTRNPSHGSIAGVNEDVAADGTLWPARATPGVNRGYRAGVLRDDFTLARVTAACGPLIVRGDGLPADYRGDALVCEPAAHLVKRYRLSDGERGEPRAEHAWERRELLTSTDERFRPVNLAEGPDGALYVVDFYRGVLQHQSSMTSFLRRQVLERGLDRPLGLGRIWRVAAAERSPEAAPDFAAASWTELAAALAHPNGWVRDTAQRLFVEEGALDGDARELALDAFAAESDLGRTHALWALEGLGAADAELVRAALRDPSELVRTVAVRLAEPHLGEEGVVAALVAAARAGPWVTRHQVLLSLGESSGEAARAALAELLREDASTPELRSAALSGLRGGELEFLERLARDARWAEERAGRAELFELLARATARDGRAERLQALVDLAAALPAEPAWQRAAVVAGRAGAPAGRVVPPLDEVGRALFEDGREVYRAVCAECHLPSGLGDPGKAPTLRSSPSVLGPDERLIRIVREGLTGPLMVGGELWLAEMPAWKASDEDVAAVLTYVRREWGHGAPPVMPERVRAVRAEGPQRDRPWTVADLEELAAGG